MTVEGSLMRLSDMNTTTMESMLLTLIPKLNAAETKIDPYVKKQIQTTLDEYLHHVREKNSRKSRLQASRIEGVIHDASQKLQNIPSLTSEHQITPKTAREINRMKDYLSDINKELDSGKIKPEEYKAVLDDAISCALHLEKFNQSFSGKRFFEPVLFMKLFINCPVTKIVTDLNEISISLHNTLKKISNFHVQNVNPSEVEKLKQQIKEIKDTLIQIQSAATQTGAEIEQKMNNSYDPTLLVNQIVNDLKIFYSEVENLQVPIAENALNMSKDKLLNVNSQINNILNTNHEIEENKKVLSGNASLILENLDSIIPSNHSLDILENHASQILGAHADFENKKVDFGYLIQQIGTIKTINKIITGRKNELTNRISGFVAAEGVGYLRRKLETVEDYKGYAKNFAFPKDTPMYKAKHNEISSVKSCLEGASMKELYLFTARSDIILNQIQEALTLLENRAIENGKTVEKLQRLNNIEMNIVKSKNYQITLQMFNCYRHQIQDIDDFSYRIVTKKMQVLKVLHDFERDFFDRHFPEIATVVGRVLDVYETSIRQLNTMVFDENSLSEVKLAKMWWDLTNDVHKKSQAKNVKAFLDIFEGILGLMKSIMLNQQNLRKTINKMNRIEQKLDVLGKRNASGSERSYILKQVSQEVDLLQKQVKRNDLLGKFSHFQARIAIETSKIKMNVDIKNKLNTFRADIQSLTHPIANTVFMEKATNILLLKEEIKDMPNGDPDLDAQKKSALDLLYSMMQRLDQDVAKHAFKKKQSENVLNVDNYLYKFDTTSISDKESVEFVRKIGAHAGSFENTIKDYLGSKDSIDFYVIDEGLMCLLEELDQLKCDDDAVLSETTKAMAYIKLLKKQLHANASPSE